MLVVANMIGAGVFTTSGFALGDLGNRSTVMWAWLIGSLIAICGAISYGQLSQRISESGGEYLYLSRFVHPSVGFVAGWVSLLAGFTGAIAFAALAFESYWLSSFGDTFWNQRGILAIPVILLFAGLHSSALRFGLLTQNWIVVIKLVLIAAFGVFAFSTGPSNWPGFAISQPHQPVSLFVFASSLVWISLSYSGFNAAVYVASEVKNVETNVPRAMLLGTICVSLIYFALNFIFIYGAPPSDIKRVPEVGLVAAESIGGSSLKFLLRAIISVALLSSVSSMVLAGPRVYAKMAEDGVFPRWIASAQNNRPVAAIWLQATAACVVVYFAKLKDLLDYLGFTLSISAAVAVGCVLWTRHRRPSLGESNAEGTDATFATRRATIFYSLIAIVYIVATLTLAILSTVPTPFAPHRPWQLVAFAITLVSGFAVYFVSRFFKRESNSK